MDLTFDIYDLSKWDQNDADVIDNTDFHALEKTCAAIAAYSTEKTVHPVTAMYDYFHNPEVFERYIGQNNNDRMSVGSIYVLLTGLMGWGMERADNFPDIVQLLDDHNIWEWCYLCCKDFYSHDGARVRRALNNWGL